MENTDKVKLITVGTYGDSVLANIMKAKLEAAGIDCALMDEVAVNFSSISSESFQPFGSIKLQVREENAEEARTILAMMVDSSTVEEELADEGVSCPYCGSKDTIVALGHSNAFAAVWSLFLSSLPFYSKKRYYCNSCKKYYKAKPTS